MKTVTAVTELPASSVDYLDCLCGIPDCKGHEDADGFIELSRLASQLLLEVEASESSPIVPRA